MNFLCTLLMMNITIHPLMALFFSAQDLIQEKPPLRKDHVFWHHRISSVGLRKNEDAKSNSLAHAFTLWQLAPKKGAGVSFALIDTGIGMVCQDDGSYRLPWALDHVSLHPHYFANMTNQHAYRVVLELNELLRPHFNTQRECEHNVMDLIHRYYGCADLSLLTQNTDNQNLLRMCKNVLDQAQKKYCFSTCVINQKVYAREFLPLVSTLSDIRAQHSTALCGIIVGKEHPLLGPIGIAPCANAIIVRACDDSGTSTKQILLQALQKVHAADIPLVNISLHVDDSAVDDTFTCEIARIIASIPYVVASSGNGTMPGEAYPARLPSVAFDVGAFDFDKEYAIAPFSRYEGHRGPKIVAPGCHLLSTVAAHTQKEYAFFNGTSCAAAVVTGFMALVLSEFGTRLTREQILKICYQATVRLASTQEWTAKTLLGTIDMRLALFIMHALCRFREKMMAESKVLVDFERDFDRLLVLVYTLLTKNLINSDKIPYFQYFLQALDYVVEQMFLKVDSDKCSFFSLLPHYIQRRLDSVLLNPFRSTSMYGGNKMCDL